MKIGIIGAFTLITPLVPFIGAQPVPQAYYCPGFDWESGTALFAYPVVVVHGPLMTYQQIHMAGPMVITKNTLKPIAQTDTHIPRVEEQLVTM